MQREIQQLHRDRTRTGNHRRAASVLVVTALILVPALAMRSAGAQWSVVQADSLLASGQVAAAESMYYATSSAKPRDAVARAALGRYLAARGALRIGAVLLEEARLFGGDSASIARALMPIYRALGDYRSLAVLPKAPLSLPERARVSWLVIHPQVLEFADSVATMPYRPASDGSGIGIVSLRVGERRVDALIDPQSTGVVLRGSAARRRRDVRVFGSDSTGMLAVIPELHIGAITLSNVAARIDTVTRAPASGKRRDIVSLLGLDVLRRLAPTFDPTSSTLLLRRTGQVASIAPGTRLPILLDESGLRVLIAGRWETSTSPASAVIFATKKWTLDAKRGEALIQ